MLAIVWATTCGWAAAQSPPDRITYFSLDELFVKPRLPLPVLEEQAQLVLLVYHAYPTPLHHVRVIGESPRVEVRSEEIAELKPTVIEPLAVRLRVKRRPEGEVLRLPLAFVAEELGCRGTFVVTLPLTEAARDRAESEAALAVGEVEVVATPLGTVAFWSYLAITAGTIALLIWRRRGAGW